MSDVAEEKDAWFRGFLERPNGIPSHDALGDVLGQIDPVTFAVVLTVGWPASRCAWMVR
jgi:hypothetical protein